MFASCSVMKLRIFCCALWTLWNERNLRIHEGVARSSHEIVNFITRYLEELEMIKERVPTKREGLSKWPLPPKRVTKINFDVAYAADKLRSGSGVVVRDEEGSILRSRAVLH